MFEVGLDEKGGRMYMHMFWKYGEGKWKNKGRHDKVKSMYFEMLWKYSDGKWKNKGKHEKNTL